MFQTAYLKRACGWRGFTTEAGRVGGSALACFKTRIAFADDVNFAFASDNLTVAVALFGGFE